MAIQEVKTGILNNIQAIRSFDLSKISPTRPFVVEWNNLTSTETKVFVEKVAKILESFGKDPSILEDVPLDQLNDLRSNLDQLVSKTTNK